jgi:ubiquinone biosynthesis UbiH/UbiF/VisC/COQ6 family hydroxylase
MHSSLPSKPADHGLDVLVQGAGIVGLTSALAMARVNLRVALRGAATASGRADVRAYSINTSSQALLERLGAWQRLPTDASTAVYDMNVVGDARGTALHFSSWQQSVRELAWIVDAAALEASLDEVVNDGAALIQRLGPDDDAVQAALLVVAEGKASGTREQLGVAFTVQPYGQHAVAARLVCERPHAHTAHQWFMAPDILALLPFDRPEPGHSFGLVWSVSPEKAQALLTMEAGAFDAELAQATQSEVGTLKLASERASWPLVIGQAERSIGPGWVLVGDAAHRVHPLAGQGLNLGLGDVAALADVMASREPWRGLGDERLLQRYARRRAWPVAAMSGVTDALQLLFAHPSPMARELRNRGLGLVEHLPPLKRWLAAEALGR